MINTAAVNANDYKITCLDRTNFEYSGYYKFYEDPKLEEKLVSDFCPHFYNQDQNEVSQSIAFKFELSLILSVHFCSRSASRMQ